MSYIMERAESLPRNKEELLARIRAERDALEQLIAPLNRQQLLASDDETGWSIKDHLAHMSAWNQKLLAVLQGCPPWVGLALDEQTYTRSDLDDINAILHERDRYRPLVEVLAHWRATHERAVALLEEMEEAAFAQPFLPQDADDRRTLMEAAADNTYRHDHEHQAGVRELAERNAN
ncbi:MAG: DinB family protein [Anaerolineae bacterium]